MRGRQGRTESRPLEFGHSGSVNPQGCQRVAGGRRGLWGRRPPGNRAGEALHPGRGARLVAAGPDRDGRCPRELSWHRSDMSSTCYRLHYHWVCATKERRPFIQPNWRPRLHEYLGRTIRGLAVTSPRFWHPAGVLDHPTRSSGGRSPFALNDHRLPSTNPAGWAPPVSSAENVQTPGAGRRAGLRPGAPQLL